MERPAAELPHCVVNGEDKLPADFGGADAICSAIVTAAQERVPGAVASVEVSVESASSLSARVSLKDGRMLAEQRMAVSDRGLNRGSIERFAAAIAGAVAGSESS